MVVASGDATDPLVSTVTLHDGPHKVSLWIVGQGSGRDDGRPCPLADPVNGSESFGFNFKVVEGTQGIARGVIPSHEFQFSCP
jgi:hypothetical protein